MRAAGGIPAGELAVWTGGGVERASRGGASGERQQRDERGRLVRSSVIHRGGGGAALTHDMPILQCLCRVRRRAGAAAKVTHHHRRRQILRVCGWVGTFWNPTRPTASTGCRGADGGARTSAPSYLFSGAISHQAGHLLDVVFVVLGGRWLCCCGAAARHASFVGAGHPLRKLLLLSRRAYHPIDLTVPVEHSKTFPPKSRRRRRSPIRCLARVSCGCERLHHVRGGCVAADPRELWRSGEQLGCCG